MAERQRWILFAYRLPREPSTPRIALWRKLRQLGAVQMLDSLSALPLNSHTREQLEWLAESVIESGGEASVWLAEPAARAQDRALVGGIQAARSDEYRAIIVAAEQAREEPAASRRRTLDRLRREMRRVRSRDYFVAPEREQAESSLDRLAQVAEVEA